MPTVWFRFFLLFKIVLFSLFFLESSANKIIDKKNQTTKSPKILKGSFDVSNSLVPIKQIFPGGPPRDGIPAINQPRFLKSKQALQIYKKTERALVVSINGKTKTYPISILNWHEIVNDQINQTTYTVTYCPLCGSGIVFYNHVRGKTLKFGVSGLLFQSDMLLYDKATDSLWSQLMRKAITGKLKNTLLPILPSRIVSLHKFLKKNPRTLVLSRNTGFKRSYTSTPYTNYENTEQLYFPVNIKDSTIHPKVWSLLIEMNQPINGKRNIKRTIIPISRLPEQGVSAIIPLGSASIPISFNQQRRIINCNSTKKIVCIPGYFFALKTFYPKASIYKNSKLKK